MDIIEKTKFNFDFDQVRDGVNFYINKYPQQQIGLTHGINAIASKMVRIHLLLSLFP